MILTPEQVAYARTISRGDPQIEALADSHEALRATNTELNRRAQLAESAARENVEAVLRAGMPLGRTLAHFAAMDARRERDAAANRVAELEAEAARLRIGPARPAIVFED